jgi:hypothetical protein
MWSGPHLNSTLCIFRTRSHCLCPPPKLLSPGQKWWRTVLEIKVVCSQRQGWGRPQLLYFGVGWGDPGIFFLLFLMCSHHIHTRFPPRSQRAPHVPNLFPTAPQLYPAQSCIPINWKVGGHIWFYLPPWGPKGCFYWGVPNVPKDWWSVKQSDPFQKQFALCLSMPLSPTVSRVTD